MDKRLREVHAIGKKLRSLEAHTRARVLSHPVGMLLLLSAPPNNAPHSEAHPGPYTHFYPWVEPRPCWFCHHFVHIVYNGTAALCARQVEPRVQASPGNGCAFWEREPGADDEPDWVPARVVPLQRLCVSPHQAPGSVT
jgi:hypothetical protein